MCLCFGHIVDSVCLLLRFCSQLSRPWLFANNRRMVNEPFDAVL